MGLSRLDNFLRSVRGTVIYVDPSNLDSTDSISNNGASATRPFKTIQRALLESSRFSYQRGLDNDRFEKTSIVVYPGEHVIDNRPGWILDGVNLQDPTQRNFILRGGVTSNNFFPFDGLTNFDLTLNNNDLYKLNSIYGGVIIPRGVSLVGMDLRKTKIRPLYVPNPENDNIERTAIFRLTGGSFFWNFSIFDALPSGQVFQDYTNNKRLPNYSHNKLSVFEYADGVNPISINDQFLTYSTDRTDLDMYYEKVSIAYGISSGRPINPTAPASNIDIQAVGGEFEIVGSRGDEYIVQNIFAGDGIVSSEIITVELDKPIAGVNVNTAIRISGVPTPGYNGSYVILEVIDSFTVRYRAATSPEIPTPNLIGVSPTFSVVVDTVNSASPYIFNVSLRSVYGMCGLHADGDKADGFKSVVVAQFTGIGLQKDNNAFVKFNRTTGSYQDSTAFPNLSSDSKSRFKPKYENYHIKASNDAFMQLVSVFAIGFAKHFVVETGGDMSITNSNSNFGSKALVASGFKRNAFPQDDVGYITHLIPPKQIESTETTINYKLIDVQKTITSSLPSNRLYFYQETNQDVLPASVVDGYRIGAKDNDLLNVIITQGTSSQVVGSRIVMSVPLQLVGTVTNSSIKSYTVQVDTFTNLPVIQNNIISFATPHSLFTGEKIRILSSIGFVPTGVENNRIYFAITSSQDPTLLPNQIKIAQSLNDAIGGNEIDINNRGQFLRVESRVSDKISGELGHPIQWDPQSNNWYINVDNNNNEIYNTILLLGQSAIGESTSRSFLTRVTDDRNLDDTIFKYRYVIPKDSLVQSRPPIDGYVIQESNNTIPTTNLEIQKYFDIEKISEISESNPYELRKPRFIASAIWSAGVATYTTELPHDLSVNSEVEIFNISSTNNPLANNNFGFNGKFTVVEINSRKSFNVLLSINPGVFSNNVSSRNINLPYFKRKKYNDTYSIFRKDEIQEYIPGERDGIYHLSVISNSISPNVSPFNDLKLSQPVLNFYPQRNRDNPISDPRSSSSFPNPEIVGEVIVNNPESSVTLESVNKFYSESSNSFGIIDIVSDSIGIAHTFMTSADHGLNRVVKLDQISQGSGYGTGSFIEEVLYNAKLVGSSTGEGATAVVKVNNGNIVDLLIIDGGSGYGEGDVLSVVGIATTTGYSPSTYQVTQIYNNVDTNFTVDGIFADPFNSYNEIYRIISIPNSREIEAISINRIPTSVTSLNLLGLSQLGQSIISSCFGKITGESVKVFLYNYNSSTGFARIITQTTHGFRLEDKVHISGFIDPNTSDFSLNYNGEFLVSRVLSLTEFEIFVGREVNHSAVVSGQQYINRSRSYSSGGSVDKDNEETGRLYTNYDNLISTLAQEITINDDQIFINDIDKLDLKLGDYIRIDYEIMRIKNNPSDNPLDSIKVFRGLMGTTKNSHIFGSYLERIEIFPIEFRRNSIIRASGHTFEYVGFGPGNYSTTLPERQDRTLSKSEESLSQSLKLDGGLSVYTGMNDAGNFYIGNKRIVSSTGKEELFDAPLPTITGEDPTSETDNFGLDVIFPDEVRIKNSLRIEGGTNKNIISEFYGPTVFNNKVKVNDDVEVNSLFIKGQSNVSRNISVGFQQPTISANPGDIVFNASPDQGGTAGWMFTTSNVWQSFGSIATGNVFSGNFNGTFTGDGSGLTGVSDIWKVDSVGIHTLTNVGIGTNTALADFTLHVFGGIKANGISEFNSKQLTFNVPVLLNFNALETRVNQSFSVIGVSTFSNNISLKTTLNNTNGRSLRFVQTDATIINDQGYGTIEWEGFDTGNQGVRGYIRGVSEGTTGQFGISFGTQTSGISNPVERLRINSSGNSVFIGPVISDPGFFGPLIGVASTATDAILTRVTPDNSNSTRFITFVGSSNEGFLNQRSNSDLTFNPFNREFGVTNILLRDKMTILSDETHKENISTIKNALNKVKNLRGVEYDRKETGEHQIGVIAQEIEKIIPEVVYENDGIKSVAYANLVGLLIEAIKEQQEQIEELKKKLI
jgi:hypothetical protein